MKFPARPQRESIEAVLSAHAKEVRMLRIGRAMASRHSMFVIVFLMEKSARAKVVKERKKERKKDPKERVHKMEKATPGALGLTMKPSFLIRPISEWIHG